MTGAVLVPCFLVAVVWQGQAADGSAPLSVCELLIHRSDLNGQMVTVRGVVGTGGHGMWLRATQTCTFKLVTRGVIWPNAVALAYPDNRSKIPTDHANFAVDWKSIRRAESEALRAGYKPASNYEVATFFGLFLTYGDLEKRVTPGVPDAPRLGFGPDLMGAPAQLLIKSIKDVSIVQDLEGDAAKSDSQRAAIGQQ